ncbi:hypothetical protein ACFOGJ_16280 [Marinibaculum pumilum]|uniref:Uncharacterized protein n=1 Tax=Marinibaculum pumilum TaxID=1766165 RepID=A0ABV7L2B4_9PROT
MTTPEDEVAIEAVAPMLYPHLIVGTDYADVPFEHAMMRPRYAHLRARVLSATFAAISAYREWLEGQRTAAEAEKRAAREAWAAVPPTVCQAARSDGECAHPLCPQHLDGEPYKSGRHCPIDDPRGWDDD